MERENRAQGCSALSNGGSTMVKHLPNHPKVKGSSPAISVSTEREKMGHKVVQHCPMEVAQW